MALQIAVMGAGCIGGWLGTRLAAGGADVTLIGRKHMADEARQNGIFAQTIDGHEAVIRVPDVTVSEDPSAARNANVVLLCVKSRDTTIAASDLAPHLHPKAVVICLQNGIANPARARAVLPNHHVVAGMVPFNVVCTEQGPGIHLVQTTSGAVVLERGETQRAVADAMAASGIPTRLHPEVARVQWAKLLLNLNNAVNALSGRALRDQLSNRGYRRVLAAAMNEGWRVLHAADIAPVALGRMHPRLAPWILPLPNPLFRLLAAPMIRIGPAARSSMADDLARGRLTEVDDINGAIVTLGNLHGVPTPVNAHLVSLIHEAERAGAGSPNLAPEALVPP